MKIKFWPIGRGRSCREAITKQDLRQWKEEIMSAISDYAAKVDTAFAEIGTNVETLQGSIENVSKDVAGLKALIDKLQNSPGSITPEDQATLDKAQAAADALAAKVKAVTENAKALADATEDAPEVPPS